MIKPIHKNIVRNLLSQGKSQIEITQLPILKNQLTEQELNELIKMFSKETKPTTSKDITTTKLKQDSPISFRPSKEVREKLIKIKNKSKLLNQLLIKHFKIEQ